MEPNFGSKCDNGAEFWLKINIFFHIINSAISPRLCAKLTNTVQRNLTTEPRAYTSKYNYQQGQKIRVHVHKTQFIR